MIKTNNNLPVGYFNFHKKQIYNFQFNRWHSLGFARFEDMKEAAEKIHSFSDWKKTFVDLAKTAEKENRLQNAAIYYRAAEFYITQKDPEKIQFYDEFINLFYNIFEKDGVKTSKIPYEKSYLHALKVPAIGKKKDTIIMHGGFDSFVEEFYYMMRIFADNGHEVIAYEGPGQGGTRRKYDLAWDEKWEKPTKTVLDFFNLDDVTIYGISMGGHLCLRAAAFEPRIKRVVTSGGAVDYFKIANPISRGMLKFFLHFKNFSTKMMIKKMNKDDYHNWFGENSMYITNIHNPIDASMKILDMNEENAQPSKITQDVLVLSSKNDHFIPIKMHNIMMKKLANAHSVTGRIFTKEDHAQNHCQIGNINLVCSVVLDWLDTKIEK
jgi:pimeloyl-ACP methyl ester carboxylesterase